MKNIIEKIKNTNYKELLSKEYDIYEILDKLKKVSKQKIKNINIILIITNIIIFISLYFIQYLLSKEIGDSIYQSNFGFFWIIIFLMLINFFKHKKIVFSIIYFITVILFFVQYFHFKIIDKPFYFSEIFYSSEALVYTDVIFSEINIKIILIFVFMIVDWLLILKLLQISSKKQNSNKISKIIIFLIILFTFLNPYKNRTIESLGNFYNDTRFEVRNNTRIYYERFNNKFEAFKIAGLYEYSIRDIYLYIKNNVGVDIKKDKQKIKQYFQENPKDNQANEYTGLLKDKNLIVIMAESIDEWLITKEIMPTVYMMKENSIDFVNRYAPSYGGGKTFNTEYSINTGLYIPLDYNIYESVDNSYDNSLANKFKKENYITNSLHFNEGSFYNRTNMHKVFGYDNSYFTKDLYDKYYKNDFELLSNNEIYNSITSKEEKFMTFFITYSAHLPYTNKNILCKDIKPEDQYKCIKRLAGYTDRAIEYLLEKLKNDDLLDDTVIVFVTDHYAYDYEQKELEKLKNGKELKDLEKVPFFIWNNNKNAEKINKYIETRDILPTILNLFDIEYSNVYIGKDVFSNNHKNHVCFSDETCVGKVNKNSKNDFIRETEINDLILKRNYLP